MANEKSISLSENNKIERHLKDLIHNLKNDVNPLSTDKSFHWLTFLSFDQCIELMSALTEHNQSYPFAIFSNQTEQDTLLVILLRRLSALPLYYTQQEEYLNKTGPNIPEKIIKLFLERKINYDACTKILPLINKIYLNFSDEEKIQFITLFFTSSETKNIAGHENLCGIFFRMEGLFNKEIFIDKNNSSLCDAICSALSSNNQNLLAFTHQIIKYHLRSFSDEKKVDFAEKLIDILSHSDIEIRRSAYESILFHLNKRPLALLNFSLDQKKQIINSILHEFEAKEKNIFPDTFLLKIQQALSTFLRETPQKEVENFIAPISSILYRENLNLTKPESNFKKNSFTAEFSLFNCPPKDSEVDAQNENLDKNLNLHLTAGDHLELEMESSEGSCLNKGR